MLDIGWMELAIIAVIALLILGPKDFPAAVRAVTQTVGKARGLANEFRSSIDEIVEESEIKKFKTEIEGELNQHLTDDAGDDENQIGSTFDYVPPEWSDFQPRRLSDSDRTRPARKKQASARLKGRRGGEPGRTSRRKVRG